MFHCVYLDPAEDADGRLYAHQVMSLDLSAVELVTLNACEGNLLRFDEFDEISGLGAAFMRAGAAAVVGALWQIRPETGETFYAALYDRLATGAGTLNAFRTAQQATRQRHPEYRDWGAFCFLGTGGFSEKTETGGRSTE
jgi:CHAT domain-containing protein